MLFDAVGFDEIFGEPVEYTATNVSGLPEPGEALPENAKEAFEVEIQWDGPDQLIQPDVVTETTTEESYPEYVVQFYRDIEQAKDDLAEAAKRKAELEVDLKLAKAEYKEALDYLVTLEKRGPVEPKPVVPPIAGTDATSEDDGEWRKISTATILDGIEGMGTRKRQAVLDEFPTLGELQDARAQASSAHKPFKSVLPKGIGGEMADRIEDKIGEIFTHDIKRIVEAEHAKNRAASTAKSEEETIEDGMVKVDLRVFDDGDSDDSESEETEEPGEELQAVEDFSSDDDLLAGL